GAHPPHTQFANPPICLQPRRIWAKYVCGRQSLGPRFFCATCSSTADVLGDFILSLPTSSATAEVEFAMSDMIPMTRAGYDKIKADMEHLENVEMPAVSARVAAARGEGDLSENAEYHGARESQGMLQAKINLLRDKLARAVLVDPTKLPKDEVVFGATVVVKDL